MGKWGIADMYFGQCDATCGTAFKINVVGSPDGSVGTTFTWGEGAVDEQIAEAFVQMAKDWTAHIIAHSMNESRVR